MEGLVQPPFFSLPRELRDQIYLLLLENEEAGGRDFQQSPCPIGSCDEPDCHVFHTFQQLSQVNRQTAKEVKDAFDLFLSDRVTLPFYDVNTLIAAVKTTGSLEGLRNARFTLRSSVSSGDIPPAKKRLLSDLGLARRGGGEIVQTINDRNAHSPCPCLETAHLGVEWRQTIYSPLGGSLRLYSWRKWYNLPWAMAPSEPRIRKWLVLEGRFRDLLETEDVGDAGTQQSKVIAPDNGEWSFAALTAG